MNEILYRQNKIAKRKKLIANIILYIVMTLLAIILLFPYVYMINKSLMTSDEVINPTIPFFAKTPMFINYVTLFQQNGFPKALLNTLTVILFNLIAVPLSASLIAYSFAKLKWKGRGFMFAVMMGTMMLPAAVTQLPLFVIYSKLNWLNTLWPFTIPNLFGGGAIYIFLIRQFMMGIPKELENAAKIDGANAFVRFAAIVLPLCVPVLIYVMINVFLAYWGDYYGPLVYLITDDAPKTFALVLFEKTQDNTFGQRLAYLAMAGGVFMSVIPAILFAIFQKQLIEGVTMTGLKG